jgi:hypothetical protein
VANNEPSSTTFLNSFFLFILKKRRDRRLSFISFHFHFHFHLYISFSLHFSIFTIRNLNLKAMLKLLGGPSWMLWVATAMVVALLPTVSSSAAPQYAVVVDAGSTGSRAFIFHRFMDVSSEPHNHHQHDDQEHQHSLEPTTSLVVEGTKGLKVTPGLSSFSDHMEGIEEYLMPLFTDAARHIPPEYHINTTVFILGTAGMRLLSHEVQENIWFTVKHTIQHNPHYLFNHHIVTARTIDGLSEAYYGVLSSNYVISSLTAELVPISFSDLPLVGSLDMGGSSTQLTFYTGSAAISLNEETGIHAVNVDGPVTRDSFWSHSWINYGVQIVREAIWANTEDVVRVQSPHGETYYDNPCAPRDFMRHFNAGSHGSHASGPILRGYGNGHDCLRLVRNHLLASRLIPQRLHDNGIDHHEDVTCLQLHEPCSIDGIRPPPLTGHFYALSGYFFIFDCLRALLGDSSAVATHWPTPTLLEMEASALAFCDLSIQQLESMHDLHPYTTNAQLSHRCLEALYIVTLLREGFGMNEVDRRITFALDVRHCPFAF